MSHVPFLVGYRAVGLDWACAVCLGSALYSSGTLRTIWPFFFLMAPETHMSPERECLWGYKGGHALSPAAAWAVASAAAALASSAPVGSTHSTPSAHSSTSLTDENSQSLSLAGAS